MIDFNIPFYGNEFYLNELLEIICNNTNDYNYNVFCEQELKGGEIHENYNSKVNFHFNNPRLGMVKNWNKCLTHGENDYVTVFHYDDLILSSYSKIIDKYINAFPDAGMFILGYKRHSAGLKYNIKKKLDVFFDKSTFILKPNFIQAGDHAIRVLRERGKVCSGVVLKREAVNYIGLFDENLKYSSDEEYWYRMASCFGIVIVPDILVSYRYHNNNYQYKTWNNDDFWDKMVETRRRRYLLLRQPVKSDIEFENISLRRLATSISNYFLKIGDEKKYKIYQRYSNINQIK